ncbi:MAG: hypothetical protein PHN49_09675, partial [Candidatus Omnitrophica bacterium]|nr:hypothetical protein [Candidatus Omnitrophota bacterium]
MKQIIALIILIILFAICALIHYSNWGAISAYEDFANQIYVRKFDKAQKKVLKTAQSGFEHARKLFEQTETLLKIRDDRLDPPQYHLIQSTWLRPNRILLKFEQTVPAKFPGSNSTYGNAVNVYRHEAEMKISFFQWKVAQLTIQPKKTAGFNIPDFSKAIDDGLKKARTPQNTRPAPTPAKTKQTTITASAAIAKLTTQLPKPSVSIPTTPQNDPNMKTFRLKNGTTVSGKVVLDDPIYYTLESGDGKQILV